MLFYMYNNLAQVLKQTYRTVYHFYLLSKLLFHFFSLAQSKSDSWSKQKAKSKEKEKHYVINQYNAFFDMYNNLTQVLK